MPFSTEGLEEGIGLALSGGGFRATLFHCGALWRLNELGLLARLARVSSVSGGSITAGRLGLRWAALAGAGFTTAALVAEVVDPLRAFCRRGVDVEAVLGGALLPWRSVAEEVAARYAEGLFGKATLQDLPAAPRFVLNATNFATAVDFRFSRPYAGDHRVGLIPDPTFPLATAVAASSAFPPFLSPVVLRPDPASWVKVPGADLYDDLSFRKELVLTDGGAYDNLGLETVWKRCRALLVSDAGSPFDYDGTQGKDWLRQGLRVISLLTHQAWSLRTSLLVRLYQSGERRGAYWGIGTPLSRYRLPDALPVPPQVTDALARLRTRLNPFDEAEQCCLVNWGYAVCDAAVRRHDPPPGAPPPPRWPYPAYALDGPGPASVARRPGADPVEPAAGP